MSLLGVAVDAGTQLIGRVFDRGWSDPAIGIGLAITLVSVAVSGFGGSSIVTLLIAFALLPIGVQAVLVLLQTRIVSIDPAARIRLNTARIVCNVIGGAIGSTLAAVLWEVGQWPAVMGGPSTTQAISL